MESKSVEVFIPVRPQHKARPRFGVRQTRSGRSFVSVHTPKETVTAESAIRAFMMAYLNSLGFREPLAGPLQVFVTFWIERPKSVKKRILPVSKPDLDNYLKLLCDALNELLWVDDSQIVDVEASKRYSCEDEPIGIALKVTEFCSAEENGQKKTTLKKGRRRKHG